MEILNDLNQNCEFFFLSPNENIKEELIAEWGIYSFFYAFIIIDKTNNNISIIEFGQD